MTVKDLYEGKIDMDLEKLSERYDKYMSKLFSIQREYLSHGNKELRDKQFKEAENDWYEIQLNDKNSI